MPQLPLATHVLGAPMPVDAPAGQRLLIPRLQFRVLVQLPNTFFPRDGIVDTGSPLSWFPEAVWGRFRVGIDYEELPFAVGYTPPRGQTTGWAFTFRMARLLQPIVLYDLHTRTELERRDVIAQFADGNPPGMAQTPRVVLGLWAGCSRAQVCA